MAPLFDSGSPTLLLSSRVSPVLSVASLARIAAEAGYAGLDLQPTRWQWAAAGRQSPASTLAKPGRQPLAALWLPADGRQFLADRGAPNTRHLHQLLAPRPERVVLELGPSMLEVQPRAAIAGMVESLRRVIADPIEITVALNARALVGGRTHLAQLTLLRRLAGEWDFDIALDLTGRVDPRWEAEAAIVRLGARLRLLRVGGPAVVGRWTTDSRPTARALTAVLQRPEPLSLSLDPPLRPWQRATAGAVRKAAVEARISVGGRIEKYHDQWAESARVDVPDRPIWQPERP